MTDEQKFFAWLDGELSVEEAAEVERQVAADPRRSALADEHRAMQARLKGVLNQVADEPVPKRLNSALTPRQAEVLDFTAGRERRTRRVGRPLTQWASAAAALVIGFFAGQFLQVHSNRTGVEVHNGAIYATDGLAHALDTQLTSAQANSAVRVELTFRDDSGSICRTFNNRQASGLACREGQRWQVRGLFAAPEAQSGDYRMAAGMDPKLAVLVDSTMTGEPFDAAQEEAARKNGWNTRRAETLEH